MEPYPIPEAARLTGLTAKELRLRIEEGRLRATMLGGRRVVEHEELDRAGLLDDGSTPSPVVHPEAIRNLVERLETQAGELAVLRRVSAERRASDERERLRLERELADARRELRLMRERLNELEARGLRGALRRQAERPALDPLFRPTRDEPESPAG